ncbi:MAG: HAMP domain-containing histidine kinase [Prolixibacteraceae bacterium]|nr:HAMP domain-containing histidine kinase [Prolixibacteraceae bacterium]
MKGKTLKYIIFLASVLVAGIIIIQFGFLKTSYSNTEKKFRESASIALKEVAWQVMLATGNTANFDSIAPVEIVNNNYYLVNLNTIIDEDLLKNYLTEELKKHEIYSDFEFAIYDPETEQMGSGILVSHHGEEQSNFEFSTTDKFSNYFGIHFTNRTQFFNSQLSVWYVFTGLLISVVLFFGYTLSVIIRQRQLSEIQKNFINNLTHELKTPISSIAISANVINNEDILKDPKRLFQYAKIIKDQNQRLSKNVENVLNLASLEKNRIILNLETISLTYFLNEIIDQFRQTDAGQKANVIFKPNNANFEITADTFHFTNLVNNILENGVKYCEKDPQLIIEIIPVKNKIALRIIDNGIGIPKDQRKKIFKKFYRVPTGNVHNVKGFGLGLDYVHKIIVAHKWSINVDENPLGGSIFTIILPKN